jgi:hypothetical protein
MFLHMCDRHGANGVLGVHQSCLEYISKVHKVRENQDRVMGRRKSLERLAYLLREAQTMRPDESGAVPCAKPAVVIDRVTVQFLLISLVRTLKVI